MKYTTDVHKEEQFWRVSGEYGSLEFIKTRMVEMRHHVLGTEFYDEYLEFIAKLDIRQLVLRDKLEKLKEEITR